MNATPLAISSTRVHERAERMILLVCEAQEDGAKVLAAKMQATYAAYRQLYYEETENQAKDNAMWAVYSHRQMRAEYHKTTGHRPVE